MRSEGMWSFCVRVDRGMEVGEGFDELGFWRTCDV